jgi:hypothetical protein
MYWKTLQPDPEAQRASQVSDCRNMPGQAQETRVYAEYLANMSTAETIDYHAISLVGPRNRVSKPIHSLPLLP